MLRSSGFGRAETRAFPSSLVSITAKSNRQSLKYFYVVLFMALSSTLYFHFFAVEAISWNSCFLLWVLDVSHPVFILNKACNSTLILKNLKLNKLDCHDNTCYLQKFCFSECARDSEKGKATLDTCWNLDFHVQFANKKWLCCNANVVNQPGGKLVAN